MTFISCATIPILIISSASEGDALFDALTAKGHPVSMGTLSVVGAEIDIDPAVIFLFPQSAEGCWEAVDSVHRLWPHVSIVLITESLTIALEDEAAMRSFVSLRVRSRNRDEFHVLAHELLAPPPDPRALALEA